MSRQRLKSFGELQQQGTGRRVEGGSRQVRVSATVGSHAGSGAAWRCRDIVLAWMQRTVHGSLPRKALRHRDFSCRSGTALCRGARLAAGESDQWAVLIERSPARDREIATEIVVSSTSGHAPVVGIRVVDRSTAPAGVEREYPADLLAALASEIPLLQHGRRLAFEPVTVESESTMGGFLRLLLDPARKVPFAVLSLPADEADRASLTARAQALARALTGLAVVWVLPPAMTFRLTEHVTRHLSVFNGAWRLYQPGFGVGSSKADHPLVLWARLAEQGGVTRASERFLRMSVEACRRAGGGEDLPSYADLQQAAPAASKRRGRLVSFLRRSIWGVPDSAAVVREPAQAPAAEPRNRGRRLRAARAKADANARRYERVRKRVAVAERQRDEAVKRAEQLSGLVRILGGDPEAEIPFPTAWAEFAAWCDDSLRGRLILTGAARRELDGARFADVDLAARCLSWLAHEYRDGRLDGGSPRLHGSISGLEGVFNVPCGGDSFECSWDGRMHTVDWHIKRGANTRDPRRCLRIYYFWDQQAGQVVVAAMPGHRRNALS